MKSCFVLTGMLVGCVCLTAVTEDAGSGASANGSGKPTLLSRTRPLQARCFGCKVGGKLPSSRPNPNYSRQSGGPEVLIEHRPCEVCAGKGWRDLDNSRFAAMVPANQEKELADSIAPLPDLFCGFKIGEERSKTVSSYYGRENLVSGYRDGFLDVMIFRGNHLDQDVVATQLEFLFGKLVGVELLLNGKDWTPAELKTRFLGSTSKETMDYRRINTAAECPTDRAGVPLLKPVAVDRETPGRVFYLEHDSSESIKKELEYRGTAAGIRHRVVGVVSRLGLQDFVRNR